MPKAHTFEAPCAVRNLVADLRGDEFQSLLPLGFAIDLAYIMLKQDLETLATLKQQHTNAGWEHFTLGNVSEASKHRAAIAYIDCAVQILNRST